MPRVSTAPLPHGAFDGYSGSSLPSVDGVSLEANLAIHHLMLDIVRLSLGQRGHQ